jgi:hypothetical protein
MDYIKKDIDYCDMVFSIMKKFIYRMHSLAE